MEQRKPISSDRSISSHKAEDKEYLVPIKGCPKLYLMVRPNSTKSWLYRYLSPTYSKNRRLSLGVYPNVSFARACDIWREYEDMLSKGQGKVNMVKDMIVPLPRQDVAILREQHKINDHTDYVFFSQVPKSIRSSLMLLLISV